MIDPRLITFKYYRVLNLRDCTIAICDSEIKYHSIFPFVDNGSVFVKFYHARYRVDIVKLSGAIITPCTFNIVLHDNIKYTYNPVNYTESNKKDLLKNIQATIDLGYRRFIKLSSFT